MRRTILLVALVVVSPVVAFAKGEGVGLWMEGTVSDVQVEGPTIQFVLTGRFWFQQYRGRERSIVEIKGEHGKPAIIPVTVTQGEPFFAMSPSWKAGAIQEQGALPRITQAASRHDRIVKFEFWGAEVAFGRAGHFTVVNGTIIRATDHDLR
jgi:hypothetical protein